MYIKKGDKNTIPVINSMTRNGTNAVMVQKYLPEAMNGDKRVMILGDEVIDFCVRKLPSNGDFKFNDHCDKNVVKDSLSQSEKVNFTNLAKELNKLGIFMAGLDVVNEKILEINVTSPCYFIKEVNQAFDIKLEKTLANKILEYTESRLSTNSSL